MSAIIISEENQLDINRLRIELAQATVDVAEVKVTDINSRHFKERVIDGLRKVSRGLDALGVVHSSVRRRSDGQG